MQAQGVEPEVALRVAPDRVDVVHVALGVVVLDQQARPLQPVVVPLGAAGPGEVDLAQPLPGELDRLPLGELVRHTPEVHAEQRAQLLLLHRREVGRGQPLRPGGEPDDLVVLRPHPRLLLGAAVHRLDPLGQARLVEALPPTMSTGATPVSSARWIWASSRERTRSRATSSAPASRRSECRPSSGDSAGSAPRKHGVVACTSPSMTRRFSETWCPPKRQAQGPRSSGSPKTRSQYSWGSRPRSRPQSTWQPSSWSRTFSSPMIVDTVA